VQPFVLLVVAAILDDPHNDDQLMLMLFLAVAFAPVHVCCWLNPTRFIVAPPQVWGEAGAGCTCECRRG
jgi:hypothetical protein